MRSRLFCSVVVASAVAAASVSLAGVAGAAPAKAAAIPKCFGKRATIFVPGNGRHVVGTKRNDVIVALGSGDVINGGAGNDVICAGAAKLVDGGAGNDKISMSGNGTVHGDAGNDTIVLGNGNAKAYGDAGNDVLTGGSGNQRLDGGAGNDRITGGTKGKFTLVGGSGNDQLVVRDGGDSVNGGLGSDALVIPAKWLASTTYVHDTADTLNMQPEKSTTGSGGATTGQTSAPVVPVVPVTPSGPSAGLSYEGFTGSAPISATGYPDGAFATSVSLPAGDVLSGWVLDFGDGSPSHEGTGLPPTYVRHVYDTAGTYAAVLTVHDDRGASATAPMTIDVAPAPDIHVTPSGTGPTLSLDLTGSTFGPGRTATSIEVDWGDGTISTPAPSYFLQHTYSGPGRYQYEIDVEDDRGGYGGAGFLEYDYVGDGKAHANVSLIYNTDLPVDGGLSATSVTLPAGTALEFEAQTSITASGAVVSSTLDPGDGSGSLDMGQFAQSGYTYSKVGGPYTAKVSVTGSTASDTASKTFSITVVPATAKAVLSTSTPLIAEGRQATFSTAGSALNAKAHSSTWTVYYDDGTDGDTGTGLPPTTLHHTFTQPGIHQISIGITDDIGSWVSDYNDLTTVTVTGARLAGSIAVDDGVGAGPELTWSGIWANDDIGFVVDGASSSPGATFTNYDIDFGDGSSAHGQLMLEDGADVLLSADDHIYGTAGTYHPTLTIHDSSGASVTSAMTVSVATRPAVSLALNPTTPVHGGNVTLTIGVGPTSSVIVDSWQVGLEKQHGSVGSDVQVRPTGFGLPPATITLPLPGTDAGDGLDASVDITTDHGDFFAFQDTTLL